MKSAIAAIGKTKGQHSVLHGRWPFVIEGLRAATRSWLYVLLMGGLFAVPPLKLNREFVIDYQVWLETTFNH